jgi:hypothetical protein
MGFSEQFSPASCSFLLLQHPVREATCFSTLSPLLESFPAVQHMCLWHVLQFKDMNLISETYNALESCPSFFRFLIRCSLISVEPYVFFFPVFPFVPYENFRIFINSSTAQTQSSIRTIVSNMVKVKVKVKQSR